MAVLPGGATMPGLRSIVHLGAEEPTMSAVFDGLSSKSRHTSQKRDSRSLGSKSKTPGTCTA